MMIVVVALEDLLRSTYRAVTTSSVYTAPPPTPFSNTSPSRRAPRGVVVAAAALVVVLAIVGTAVLLSGTENGSNLRPLGPVDEQPLFPDVVPHQGPELLLAPQYVPDGYQLVSASGPDPSAGGGGGALNETISQWVKLDVSGTVPVSAFSLGWGPLDFADEVHPPTPGPPVSVQHQDAIASAANREGAESITVNGHRGVWSTEQGPMIEWEQDGQALTLAAATDAQGPTWSEHLSRAQIEALARTVVRRDDGSFQVDAPQEGFRLAGSQPGYVAIGTNVRRLVYRDSTLGHGFTIQFVQDTQVPPGIALSQGGSTSRLVDVRGQRAVQTRYLSSCSSADQIICDLPPDPGNHNYVQWLEPDSTRVTLFALGVNGDELVRIARSLQPITAEQWDALRK